MSLRICSCHSDALLKAFPDLSFRHYAEALVIERAYLGRASRKAQERRDWLARRVEKLWDVDQRDRVEKLALRIMRQPGMVVARLKTTAHGTIYLIERWRLLLGLVESEKFTGVLALGPRQKALALLGVPRDEWLDNSSYPFDPDHLHQEEPDWLEKARTQIRKLILEQLEDLQACVEVLKDENHEQHQRAMQGEFHVADKELTKWEREVSSRERRIRSLEKLKDQSEKRLKTLPKPANPDSTSSQNETDEINDQGGAPHLPDSEL